MSYAKGTTVAVENTQAELNKLLRAKGATRVYLGGDSERGAVMFEMEERQVRLSVPVPALATMRPRTGKEPRGWFVWDKLKQDGWCSRRADQRTRELWRALLLVVKAKLEAVEAGISTVEREFLADVYLPDGVTVHTALRQQLAQMHIDGKVPPLLGPAPKED